MNPHNKQFSQFILSGHCFKADASIMAGDEHTDYVQGPELGSSNAYSAN